MPSASLWVDPQNSPGQTFVFLFVVGDPDETVSWTLTAHAVGAGPDDFVDTNSGDLVLNADGLGVLALGFSNDAQGRDVEFHVDLDGLATVGTFPPG